MSSRPLKTYSQGAASVELPEAAITAAVAAYADEITDAIAKEVLRRAKASTVFVDKSGQLRKSGKRRKSRFNEDEKIVQFSAPHAHLVEHGHALVKKNRVIGHVPAHPFLGPARDAVAADLDNIIKSIVPPTIKVGS